MKNKHNRRTHFCMHYVFTGHSEQQREGWWHQLFPLLSGHQLVGYWRVLLQLQLSSYCFVFPWGTQILAVAQIKLGTPAAGQERCGYGLKGWEGGRSAIQFNNHTHTHPQWLWSYTSFNENWTLWALWMWAVIFNCISFNKGYPIKS